MTGIPTSVFYEGGERISTFHVDPAIKTNHENLHLLSVRVPASGGTGLDTVPPMIHQGVGKTSLSFDSRELASIPPGKYIKQILSFVDKK